MAFLEFSPVWEVSKKKTLPHFS